MTVIGNNIIKASVDNQTTVADTNLSGQGCAIYGNYLFRLHNKGYCSIYDISNIANIKHVAEYELGSYSDDNHVQCGSFAKDVYEDTGFPLLYTAGLYGNKAYVDSVSLNGSTHIQTITFDLDSLDTEHYYPQAVVGNDGYLWVLAFPAWGSGGAPHDKW